MSRGSNVAAHWEAIRTLMLPDSAMETIKR